MNTKWRQISALLWKDLLVHGRQVGLLQLAIIVGHYVLLRESDTTNRIMEAISFNAFMTMNWSRWLISREKTRQTFGWLRTLPLHDSVIVSEKYFAYAFCCGPLWIVMSLMRTREIFWTRSGAPGLAILLALLIFGGISILTQLMFREKVGQMIPFFSLFGGAFATTIFLGKNRSIAQHLVDFWRWTWGPPLILGALLLIYLAIFSATVKWFQQSETYLLLE
jgi:hypothetical protein